MNAETVLLLLNGAAFGALMASGVFSFFHGQRIKKTIGVVQHVQADIDRILAAAKRVLSSPDVSGEPREAILILLHGLANRDFGIWLMDRLSRAERDTSGKKSSLVEAIDDLREINPALADDFDFAMLGISNLAIPMAYRVGEVAEIAAQTPTPERRVANFVGSVLKMRDTALQGQLSLNV